MGNNGCCHCNTPKILLADQMMVMLPLYWNTAIEMSHLLQNFLRLEYS
jgi:hypothetical protein